MDAETDGKLLVPLGSGSPLGWGPFGERPPIPANDQGSNLSRSVSADLEQIFAGPADPDPATPRRAARVRTLATPAPAEKATSSRATSVGGVVAAALVGVVVGSLLLKPQVLPRFGQRPAPVAAAPGVAALPDAQATTRVERRAARVETAPVAKAKQRSPKLVAKPIATPKAAKPSPIGEGRASRAEVRAAERRLRSRPSEARASRTEVVPADRPQRPVTSESRTSRADVLAADRRLRQAYAAAGRAGVPRQTLAAAREHWVALRGRDPRKIVSGYENLARDLEEQAQASDYRKSHWPFR